MHFSTSFLRTLGLEFVLLRSILRATANVCTIIFKSMMDLTTPRLSLDDTAVNHSPQSWRVTPAKWQYSSPQMEPLTNLAFTWTFSQVNNHMLTSFRLSPAVDSHFDFVIKLLSTKRYCQYVRLRVRVMAGVIVLCPCAKQFTLSAPLYPGV